MSLMNSIAMPLLVINRDVSQARDRAIFFEQEDAAYQAVNYLISQAIAILLVSLCQAIPRPVNPA